MQANGTHGQGDHGLTGMEYQSEFNCDGIKSKKHWGPRRNGGGKVVGVVPTKFHPNQNKIVKVCFWGGFWVGGVG